MSDWERCAKCKRKWDSDRLLQARIRHTLMKEGAGAARIDAHEVMQAYHEGGHDE